MDRGPLKPADAGGDWTEGGLLGSRPWGVIIKTEAARCQRYGATASVVIVEVPDLEEVAAAWGPDVRDVALTQVGKVLRSAARSSDYVARLESRRFAVLLPETDEIAAVNFVERARVRCDAALPSRDDGYRCRFGWADARPSRTLEAAAALAASRLAADR